MIDQVTPDKNSSLAFINTALMFGLCVLILTGIFSYILVESRTKIYLNKIVDIDKICFTDKANTKFIKVLDYRKQNKYAKIYCGYYNSRYNRTLVLNYTQEWKIVLDTQINKEGGISWPIYI